jgi:molybdopterin-dependent oxidoreductase alpha subunit
LLTGVAKRIVEWGAHDDSFLREYCSGSQQWLDHLQTLDWSETYAKSGVVAATIDSIAKRYAAAKNVVFSWTMGITHHTHGVENVQAIANLALLRGMVGKPHAGLLPIRGHSNVQGIGSMGVTPQLKQAVFERLQTEFDVKLPTTSGLDTLACIEQSFAGRLKMGFCLGGNLYGSNPDSSFAAEALSRLDTVVYLNTSLNTGHAHGLARETIILPVLARDEEPEPTTQESMFNYVRLSDGGPVRHEGPRSEVCVIAEVADQVLGDRSAIDWRAMQHTGRIREAIAQIVPGFERLRDIDRTKQEFQIEGRVLHRPKFATADGRAVMHVHRLPELPGNQGELRLMTIRSEGQFNTVVYDEEDLYRGQDRRDVILMHPHDLARFDLQPDQRVTVRSATGTMTGILARAFPQLKPGNAAMYYPEANVLVPRSADPRSRTPAFKSIVVCVEGDRSPTRRASEKEDPQGLSVLYK